MSENSPVTFAHKMFWGEHKLLQFPVAGGQNQINAWALQWQLWRSEDKEPPPLITKTSSAGITVIDTPSGICQVTLTADDWDEVDPEVAYYYELWRTDAGAEQCLAFGEFFVR